MYPLEFLDLLNTKMGKYLKLSTLHIDTLQKQRYSNKALRLYTEELFNSFENNNLSRNSLKALISRDKLTNTDILTETNSHLHGIVFVIPENFRIIEEYIEYESTYVQVKPITYDYYIRNINNPKRKPNINYLFWALDLEEDKGSLRREVITDGTLTDTTSINYNISFIKNPTEFDFKTNSTESEYDKNSLDKIADLTVQLIYEDYSKLTNKE